MSAPDWINGDPADLRRWRALTPEALAPALPPDVTIVPLSSEGECPGGLLFAPPLAREPNVLYFHGGGFFVGSPETHRIVAAWIAHLTGAQVLSVRYRLAPEHPVPAQGEDAAAAIRRHLATEHRVRLAGDSAGALVALWGFARLAPEEQARIAGALLIYGTYGLPPVPGPDDATLEAQGLGPRSIGAMWGRVDPEGRMRGDPALDPLAPGFPLPRLVLVAAGSDPVLADSVALAQYARAPLIVAKGQLHGFLSNLPAPEAVAPLRGALDALSA